MKNFIILITIVLTFLIACAPVEHVNAPYSESNDDTEAKITLIEKVELTGTTCRPQLIISNDKSFVIFTNNNNNPRTIDVRIFSKDFKNIIINEKTIIEKAEHGGLTDVRVTSDESYVYAFYQTNDESKEKSYLFGVKFELNTNFNKVIGPFMISDSKSNFTLSDGDEVLDDPIPLITNDSISVITRFKGSYEMDTDTIYKVYNFQKDFTLISSFDLDLSDTADGGARQSSALYNNGYHYMVLPTTSGPAGDSVMNTKSQILIVKFNTDLEIIDSKIVSNGLNDTEAYVMGFKADNDYLYLSYMQVPVTNDLKYNLELKIIDKNFNFVASEIVHSDTVGSPASPNLELSDGIIYSSFSYGKMGEEKASIYIYNKNF